MATLFELGDIQQRLHQWALVRRGGKTGGTGFSATGFIDCDAEQPSITDEQAMVIDLAMAELKRLNKRWWAAVHFRYIDEATHFVLAKKLGCSEGTVRRDLDVGSVFIEGAWLTSDVKMGEFKA